MVYLAPPINPKVEEKKDFIADFFDLNEKAFKDRYNFDKPTKTSNIVFVSSLGKLFVFDNFNLINS